MRSRLWSHATIVTALLLVVLTSAGALPLDVEEPAA